MLQRCRSCGMEQEQDTQFGVTAMTPSGYRFICLACDEEIADTLTKVCAICQDCCTLDSFPAVYGNPDEHADMCYGCLTYLEDTRQRWCPGCGEIVAATEFTVKAGKSLSLSSRCTTCVAAITTRTAKRCIGCGDLKPLDAFPRHNSSLDGHRHECRGCLYGETVVVRPPRVVDRRFPFPSVPRFVPDIGPFAEVDWQEWARDLLAEPTASVILDVETTGFTFTDAIVEIALVDLTGTVLLDTLLDPRTPIPTEATAKHGITDAMVAGQPCFADVQETLMAHLAEKCVLAYNVQFDVRMVQSAFLRLGDPLWTPVANACLQRAFAAYRVANPVRVPTIHGESLVDACGAMGIVVSQIHRAGGDCGAALDLLRVMAFDG